MKRFKRFVSRVLVLVLFSTLILPMFSPLEVRADDKVASVKLTKKVDFKNVADSIKDEYSINVINDLCVYYNTCTANVFGINGGKDDVYDELEKGINKDSGVQDYCYKVIIESLRMLRIENEPIDFEASGFPTEAKIGTAFGNTTGIYYTADYTHGSQIDNMYAISCDYNSETKTYYYMVLLINLHKGAHTQEDDTFIFTFSSDKFIYMCAAQGDSAAAGINITVDLGKEQAAQLLSGIYNKDTAMSDFKNNTVSGKDMYTSLNEYARFAESSGSEGKYLIEVNTPYLMGFYISNNQVIILADNVGSQGKTVQKSNELPSQDSAEMKEFINFGDLTFGGSDKYDLIGAVFANIFCDLCSTDGIPVNEFQGRLETFANNTGDGCIKDVLLYYAEALAKESEATRLSKEYAAQNPVDGDFSKIDSSDPYEILSFILGYNIHCAVTGDANFNSGKYIIYGSDSRVNMSFDWDNKDTGQESIHDIWDKLTSEQKDILSTLYNLTLEERNIPSVKTIGGVTRHTPNTNYDSGLAVEFANANADLIDIVKATVSGKDSNLRDTNSIYNIARNSNSIMQYLIGTTLYGEGTGGPSIYDIYDDTLASLINSLGQFNTEINTDYWPYHIPDTYDLFGTSSKYISVLNSSENGYETFVALMLDISYAFDVAAFSEGAQENYDPEALREYFKSGTYKAEDGYNADVEFSWFSGNTVDSLNGTTLKLAGDEVSINMLRSIIELHDLCEFLGIYNDALNGGWTDAIEQYLNIYKEHESFFNALRSNPYIYSRADKGEKSADEPLGVFFNIENKKMSDQWCKGFAASALYVPMETNLYDATSISYINDPDFISDFYYKYAFYRKALYINTDNSAIVNAKVSGSVSGTRVATLRDLLNYERDIILTVDDNFYNAKDINSVIGNLDYSTVRNGSSTNTDTGWESLKNWVGDLFDLSPEQILKTGANSYYSSTLAKSVTKLGGTPTLKSSIADVYLLSEEDLLGKNSVFDEYEYSVKQSYGVVSAVYRSAKLYNECLRALASDNAVFKSSKGICATPGTTSSDWRSIYNYCMLANLEEQMKNDTASTLDLDAPIFCDLFGNIVTESGLVIIPASCNATLCGANWNPNTVGWSEYYNNGNRLETGEFSDEVYEWLTGVSYESNGTATQQVQYVDHYYGDEAGENDQDKIGDPVYKTYTISTSDALNVGQYGEEVKHDNAGGYMIVDRSGQLMLRTSSLSGSSTSAIIQWENLNKNSTVVKELFYNDAYFNKAASGEIYSKTIVNLVVETLRGAPIEYIDYEYEGISGNTDISKFGVYMAYKLEELTNALISGTNGNSMGGNALITMPNLAFVTGVEYIVLYVFKVVFAIMLVGLAISLYLDAVKNHLGIKSVGKFLFTCILVIVAITLAPNLISWSYYKANKDLLASESGYIMMLNYVKDYDGAEIGITNVTTPETTTELYVKLDDVSVDWWDVIGEVLFNNTYKTVTELYESQLTDNAMAMQDNVQLKGDGLYMDVQDIFNSTSIVYYPSQNRLGNIAYSNSTGTGTAGDRNSVVSFVLPYYVILDKLVANIDEYNQSKDITAYSWSVGSNGHIMTYDIISPYLTSSEFLDEGFDILGLNEVLQTDVKMTSYTEGYFNNSQIERMKMSKWYPTGSTKDQLTQDRINEIYKYARDYVAKNEDILGKIPDEVFLKVFALQLSIKFNQVFNIHSGNAIEIMNIDTRDIARLLVSDKGSVYKYYSYGFARFTYEESGTLGVIFAALYFVVLWMTSILKPLLMILILGLLIINVIFRKMLFRKESRCIEGYLIGCACLVACNYAYAIMLKVSLSISEYGFGTVAALAVALLVQVLYVMGLCAICVIEIKDWKNSGFNEFSTIGASITSNILHAQSVIADKVMSRQNSAYGDAKRTRTYKSDNYDINSVDEMLDRDDEREENGTYSQI